jgi:hypothetical protein
MVFFNDISHVIRLQMVQFSSKNERIFINNFYLILNRYQKY